MIRVAYTKKGAEAPLVDKLAYANLRLPILLIS